MIPYFSQRLTGILYTLCNRKKRPLIPTILVNQKFATDSKEKANITHNLLVSYVHQQEFLAHFRLDSVNYKLRIFSNWCNNLIWTGLKTVMLSPLEFSKYVIPYCWTSSNIISSLRSILLLSRFMEKVKCSTCSLK